jgi:hypothetical protein
MNKPFGMLLIAMGLCFAGASATTVDGQFSQLYLGNGRFVVGVLLKVDVAAGLGQATLEFTFNNSSLTYPASPISGSDYSPATFGPPRYSVSVTRPLANKVSISIVYASGGTMSVSASWTTAIVIIFSVANPQGNSDLAWVTNQCLAADMVTPWTVGTFTGLNVSPLPITLSSFTASHAGGTNVLLTWHTLSEIDNLGFDVERSLSATGTFDAIPGSFTPGHGTTVDPHDYSYTDTTTGGKDWWYRLKQTDRSGGVNYSEATQAMVTALAEEIAMPTAFGLDQNYPNPFNPSTSIRYALPQGAHVTLIVYNVLGQEVAKLADDVQAAGYHTVTFDASSLGSGVYLYRLVAGKEVFLKKMLLVK